MIRTFASAIALTACLLMASSLPAFAGHWEITYTGSGSYSDWGDTYSWPPTADTGKPYYHVEASDGDVGFLSGDVHAVLKWIPDSASDTAPMKIVVHEYASAGAGSGGPPTPNFTADCDNGIGSPTVFHRVWLDYQYYDYYDAIGTKIRVIDVPPASAQGQTVVTLQSRHLSVTGTPGYMGFHSYARYQVAVTNLEILRDSQRITPHNNRVLPGQRMTLSVTGADVNTTYTWGDPPGDDFKFYDGAKETNQLTRLQPEDFTQPWFNFYWTKGDDASRTVTCMVQVAGQAVSVQGNFTVVKPLSTMEAFWRGTVRFEPNNQNPTKVGLLPDPQQSQGIEWESAVTTINGMGGAGRLCHVQLVKPRRYIRIINQNNQVTEFIHLLNGIDPMALDTRFPYDGTDQYPLYVDSVPYGSGDSPQFPSLLPTMRRLVTGDDQNPLHEEFTVYLMFRPEGFGNCWVPLRKLDWWWSMGAAHFTPWQLSLDKGKSQSIETDVHPTWSRIAIANQFMDKNSQNP